MGKGKESLWRAPSTKVVKDDLEFGFFDVDGRSGMIREQVTESRNRRITKQIKQEKTWRQNVQQASLQGVEAKVNMAREVQFMKAEERVQGKKVHDNIYKLKKKLVVSKRKKAKSSEAWAKRKEEQTEKTSKRQKERTDNIANRKKNKGKGGSGKKATLTRHKRTRK